MAAPMKLMQDQMQSLVDEVNELRREVHALRAAHDVDLTKTTAIAPKTKRGKHLRYKVSLGFVGIPGRILKFDDQGNVSKATLLQRKRREKAKAKAAAASTLGARDPEPVDEDAALDALSDSAVLLTTLPPLPENADSSALYRALIATVDANASCLKQYVARMSARKLAPSATPTLAKSRIVAGLEFPPSPVPFPFTPQRPAAQGAVPAQLASDLSVPAHISENVLGLAHLHADMYARSARSRREACEHVTRVNVDVTMAVAKADSECLQKTWSDNVTLLGMACAAASSNPSSFETPRRG